MSNSDEFDESQPAPNEFEKLFEESLRKPQRRLSVGDKIRGEILVIGKEDVYVSTGTPADGAVPRRDIIDKDGNLTHKVGDMLDLYVTMVKGTEIYLSTQPTALNVAEDIEDAFDKMLPVEGRVAEVVKGGVRVSLMGQLAFCPLSQLDIARVENPEEYVGKKYEFMITKFADRGRDIVVSRRRVLEEQRELSEAAFTEERKEGTTVSGKVKRIEPFGAFVEVAPGVEGLVHVSEMAWSRTTDPNEIVKVSQDVVVKILNAESKDGKLRISLSMKQVGPTPWEMLPPQIEVGAVVEGAVTRCMKFGAFVELAPGIEGLIPLSEMSYTRRVLKPDDFVKAGEKVSVKIKEIQPESKRISLSLRDAGEDPWALAPQKYAISSIHTGKVVRKEPYGIFVQLEEGVIALLPKSKAIDHPEFSFDKVKVGDEAVVQIGELRHSERKISLELPNDSNRDDWKGYAPSSASGGFATLGDKLKSALAKKKS